MNDKSFEEIIGRFRTIEFQEKFDLIVAVANGGIIPAALLNQRLGCDIQLLKLHLRDDHQHQLYDQPKLLEDSCFDVKDKRILLVEDRVKTGTTLDFAKKLLIEAGAGQVITFAVNGQADYSLYNESCFRFPWCV
jgi:xanthine phosphoribosyltransferase